MLNSSFAVVWLILAAIPAPGEQSVKVGKPKSVGVTIYNQGFGLVRENRTIRLTEGRNSVVLDDVAARIEPASVHFESLTAPAAVVVREQNYQYDLLNPLTLLNKSVGRRVTVRQRAPNGSIRDVTGTLIAPASQFVAQTGDSQDTYQPYSTYTVGGFQYGGYGTTNGSTVYNGLILQTEDGKLALNPSGDVLLHEIPPDLVAKPQLAWLVDSTRAGDQNCLVSYLTGGINWKADYVVVTSQDDRSVDLTGWVTLDNQSGVAYRDAELQLVAGDVKRAQPPRQPQYMGGGFGGFAGGGAPAPQFRQESFFEYHLYSLEGRTTVRDKEQKQMTLLTAAHVPATKRFVYDGRRQWWLRLTPDYRPGEAYDTSAQHKVNVVLELKNTKPELGIPLPKGTMKVYKADSRGNMEFIGEDAIDHTPKDEMVRLYVGDSFDVVGEHKRTNFRWVSQGTTSDETFEITLRNHRQSDMEVTVVEHLWGDWTILEKSTDYVKRDAHTVEFPVTVPKDGETKVTYTVRTVW